MLNYVRHDEEFHCSIKLMNGDEIVGLELARGDDRHGDKRCPLDRAGDGADLI